MYAPAPWAVPPIAQQRLVEKRLSHAVLARVCWLPLSTRHVEELMEERGVEVDHSTINRWVIKYSPQLEEAFHRRKRPVWVSWRMDETYIKVKGVWRYLYRAVDKYGETIDFLLTEQRDTEAALRPNCSTPWPLSLPTDRGNCPFTTSCAKFATQPTRSITAALSVP